MARFRSQGTIQPSDNLALILVDYDNLVGVLSDGDIQRGHDKALQLLERLRNYLGDELRLRPVRAVAYGDYAQIDPVHMCGVMNDLVGAAVEIRHVPVGIQPTDAATSLTIHATELLHARPDFSAFVVLSGDNWYVPLVQHLQRFGKFVLVVALDLPPFLSEAGGDVSDAFLNARMLLDADDRDSVARSRPVIAPAQESEMEVQARAPKTTERVDDDGAYRALELIEDCFGKYEEVYLTPLLRKMTENLEQADGEPKELVNLLEEAGVVWLEKRRGFPYDYTVLLVNESHPDVLEVRGASENGDAGYSGNGFGHSYDEPDQEYTDSHA